MKVRELRQSSAKSLAVSATARWLMRGVTTRMVENASFSKTVGARFKEKTKRCNHSHIANSLDTAYSRTPCEPPSNAGGFGAVVEDMFELVTPMCFLIIRASSTDPELVE